MSNLPISQSYLDLDGGVEWSPFYPDRSKRHFLLSNDKSSVEAVRDVYFDAEELA